MKWIEFIQWAPLIVALIAGLFALMQIRLNNITNARIRWLDALRQLVADFSSEVISLSIKMGVISHVDALRESGHHSNLAEEFTKALNGEKIPQLQRIQLKYDLIRLNLNPKEEIHIQMETILDRYMDMINEIPIKEGEELHKLNVDMRVGYEKLILISRLVMKLEWEKAKQVPFRYWVFMKCGLGKTIKQEALSIFWP
jgi:hypothetical protein